MPNSARLLLHDSLKYFLGTRGTDGILTLGFQQNPTVKHLAESNGVPHTEIGQVMVNGMKAGLDTQVQDGDTIDIFPIVDQTDHSADEAPRFILDVHLGRLAAYLRMLGYDCLYRNDFEDREMAEIAGREDRILLTRDRRLLMRKLVTKGCCVRESDPHRQLVEAAARFGLGRTCQPFKRCLRCNGLLEPVSKEAVLERLEPLTKKYYDEFHICRGCGQVYWKGSHYEHMLDEVMRVLGPLPDA